jgi:hypothetical protein
VSRHCLACGGPISPAAPADVCANCVLASLMPGAQLSLTDETRIHRLNSDARLTRPGDANLLGSEAERWPPVRRDPLSIAQN